MLAQPSTSQIIYPPGSQYQGSKRYFRDHQDRDEVKRRAEEDFLSLYLEHGGTQRWKSLKCLFHEDRSPSASIHRGRFHCFGCGISLDVFEFVQRVRGEDFKGALAFLAARYGVPISNLKPTRAENLAWRERQDERELIEHFRLVEFFPAQRASIEFSKQCQADPGYKAWLRADLSHAHAVCGLIVGMIALAQERDGDFPATQEAA